MSLHIRTHFGSPPGARPARPLTHSRLPMTWIYLAASVLFTGLYHQMTREWSIDDCTAFMNFTLDYRFSDPLFRFRVLTPLLARLATQSIPLDPVWIFRGMTTAFVFGSLSAYRKYLSNFMRSDFAAVLSLALIYPMLWNLCVLNNLCLPFDPPSMMLFVLGCHFIYQKRWRAYYAVLALATLNRETSCFLIAVFLLTMWGELKKRTLAEHMLAQVLLWGAIKGLAYIAVGPDQRVFSTYRLGINLRCMRDVLVLQNDGPKDLIKIVLCCGGIYWLIPWVRHGLPRFVKRSLSAILPFLAIGMVMHFIDEARGYVEVIPLLLTPILYRVAADLGGATPPDRRK